MYRYLMVFMVCVVITGVGVVYAEPYSEPVEPYEEIGNMWFDSLNVRFVGNWPFGPSYAVAYDSARSLLFCGSGGGVYILDGSNPTNPMMLSEKLHTRGAVWDFFYDSILQRLYIADGVAGLEIWNVNDPLNPEKLGFYDTPDFARGVYVSDSYAYIADEDS